MQITKPKSRWDGGVMDIYHVPNAHSTMNFIIKKCSSYASPNSKFYKSEGWRQAMARAMSCIVKVQHDTIDLYKFSFYT